MDWWMHNPIADMYGPQFLLFYGCVIVITLIIVYLWRVGASDSTAHLPPLSLPANPDPYEIAYLRGGKDEVKRVVVFGLIQRSYLQVTEEKLWIFSKGQKLVQALKHPSQRHLSPVERVVFEFFSLPRKAADIFQSSSLSANVQWHCRDYEVRLQKDQLLCSPEVKEAARRGGLTGALIILGLGGYKLAVALRKGRYNVFLLILMVLVSLIILLGVCQTSRLSRRGQGYLKRFQEVFERLKPKAEVATPGVPDPTLLLLVSLFGVSVLAGTSYAYFEGMFRQAAASGGGGGCGGCGGG